MILMLYYCCCETFPTFTNKFGYINKYHIGYITGDLYPKIFFFANFSKIITNLYNYNKVGNV